MIMKEVTSEKMHRSLCDILKVAGQGDALGAFERIWLKAPGRAARRLPNEAGFCRLSSSGVLKAWAGSETLV